MRRSAHRSSDANDAPEEELAVGFGHDRRENSQNPTRRSFGERRKGSYSLYFNMIATLIIKWSYCLVEVLRWITWKMIHGVLFQSYFH